MFDYYEDDDDNEYNFKSKKKNKKDVILLDDDDENQSNDDNSDKDYDISFNKNKRNNKNRGIDNNDDEMFYTQSFHESLSSNNTKKKIKIYKDLNDYNENNNNNNNNGFNIEVDDNNNDWEDLLLARATGKANKENRNQYKSYQSDNININDLQSIITNTIDKLTDNYNNNKRQLNMLELSFDQLKNNKPTIEQRILDNSNSLQFLSDITVFFSEVIAMLRSKDPMIKELKDITYNIWNDIKINTVENFKNQTEKEIIQLLHTGDLIEIDSYYVISDKLKDIIMNYKPTNQSTNININSKLIANLSDQLPYYISKSVNPILSKLPEFLVTNNNKNHINLETINKFKTISEVIFALNEDIKDELNLLSNLLSNIFVHLKKLKEKLYQSYLDAYISISLPNVIEPIIYMNILDKTWGLIDSLLDSNTDSNLDDWFINTDWYIELSRYSKDDMLIQTTSTPSIESDNSLLLRVLRKTVIPYLIHILTCVFNPISSRHSYLVSKLSVILYNHVSTILSIDVLVNDVISLILKKFHSYIYESIYLPMFNLSDNLNINVISYIEYNYYQGIQILGNIYYYKSNNLFDISGLMLIGWNDIIDKYYDSIRYIFSNITNDYIKQMHKTVLLFLKSLFELITIQDFNSYLQIIQDNSAKYSININSNRMNSIRDVIDSINNDFYSEDDIIIQFEKIQKILNN